MPPLKSRLNLGYPFNAMERDPNLGFRYAFDPACVACPASLICLTHKMERLSRHKRMIYPFDDLIEVYFYDQTGVGYPMETSEQCPLNTKRKSDGKLVVTKPARTVRCH